MEHSIDSLSLSSERGFLLIFIFRWFLRITEFSNFSPYQLPHLFHLRRYHISQKWHINQETFPQIFRINQKGSPSCHKHGLQVNSCPDNIKPAKEHPMIRFSVPIPQTIRLFCQMAETGNVGWCRNPEVNVVFRTVSWRMKTSRFLQFLYLSCTFWIAYQILPLIQSFKIIKLKDNHGNSYPSAS